MHQTRAIFLDRDGTLIQERNYLSDPEGVQILPGAVTGLKHLQSLGFALIIVTNQAGIGRGYFSTEQLTAVHDKMLALFANEGVDFAGLYYCPHAPQDDCDCRKPKTGLIEQAAHAVHFSMQQSFMIGDKQSDVALGRAAGMRSILVRTGYGAQCQDDPACIASSDFIADDLQAAAAWIETAIAAS